MTIDTVLTEGIKHFKYSSRIKDYIKNISKKNEGNDSLNELIENLSVEKLNLEQIIYSLETSVNIAELMEISLVH